MIHPWLALSVSLSTTLLPASLDRDEDWAEDLFFLVEELERLHPTPHHATSQEAFEQAVSLVYERIPELTDDQMMVELMRLFGQHGSAGKEGHCGVWLASAGNALPIRLYAFEDGWFIVDTVSQGDRDLIGARVTGVEGTPMDEVVAAVSPLVSRDNDTNLLGKLPSKLGIPQVLHGLGITRERAAATLELELPDGSTLQRSFSGGTGSNFSFGLPRDSSVLWLTEADSPWWTRALEDEGALYVQFNLTRASDGTGKTLVAFADEVVKGFHASRAERLILDLRSNGGGDNTTFGPLVNALRDDPAINRRGTLFCLMGRGTFSAAGNLVTVLEQETEVLLVGEPTGGGPNQFGDAQTVHLPNHPELRIRISTRYHQFDAANQDRLTHAPDLAVPLPAKDYFAGRDPVLARALSFDE